MAHTMQSLTAPWQGLGLRLMDHHDELADPSCELATELLRLGGDAPVAVLVMSMVRHGYPMHEVNDAIVDGIADQPDAFAFYSL